jgi:hypothetical protein
VTKRIIGAASSPRLATVVSMTMSSGIDISSGFLNFCGDVVIVSGHFEGRHHVFFVTGKVK